MLSKKNEGAGIPRPERISLSEDEGKMETSKELKGREAETRKTVEKSDERGVRKRNRGRSKKRAKQSNAEHSIELQNVLLRTCRYTNSKLE